MGIPVTFTSEDLRAVQKAILGEMRRINAKHPIPGGYWQQQLDQLERIQHDLDEAAIKAGDF